GTTMACAQCHTHKYDPITQEEYFRFFAFFNCTEDADRRDESPLLEIYTAEQLEQKAAWQTEIAVLEQKLGTLTPELQSAMIEWETGLKQPLPWQTVKPSQVTSAAQAAVQISDDGKV